MTKSTGRRPRYGSDLSTKLNFYSGPLNENGCILWTGAIKDKDHPYGILRFQGIAKGAHVLAYELANGPVPKGMEVCHTCDVPGCIALGHLFVATHKQNMEDMVRKSRQNKAKGIQHGRAKLSEAQVHAIRADKRDHIDVAARYGVSRTLIRLIRERKAWKHI